jgi:pimeloyl-ACP methyl ester carboxylesterase
MTTSLALTTIVLIHGLGGDRHSWDDVIQRLGKSRRVITVELPGHGDNLPAPKTLSLDAIARQIAARVRAEKAAPAIIVGHSLGGIVAAHVPLVDPGAVRGLVIVDMILGPTWQQNEIEEMSGTLATDREAALRGWFGRICKPEQLDRLLVGLRKLSNETLVGYMHAMRDGWVRDGGRAIGVPTLLMASKLILPAKKARAEELAEGGFAHVGKLQVETFDRSMHWIMWDEPDKFVTTLSRFVDGLR